MACPWLRKLESVSHTGPPSAKGRGFFQPVALRPQEPWPPRGGSVTRRGWRQAQGLKATFALGPADSEQPLPVPPRGCVRRGAVPTGQEVDPGTAWPPGREAWSEGAAVPRGPSESCVLVPGAYPPGCRVPRGTSHSSGCARSAVSPQPAAPPTASGVWEGAVPSRVCRRAGLSLLRVGRSGPSWLRTAPRALWPQRPRPGSCGRPAARRQRCLFPRRAGGRAAGRAAGHPGLRPHLLRVSGVRRAL